MIRLGKLTDYAIVVMVQLAREGAAAAKSASQLAEVTALPEPTVAKVLKTLLKAGFVSSQRGAQGGYKLARDAESVTIRDIIEAVDGPIAIVTCVEGSQDHCQAEAQCPTRGKWEPVNNAIRTALHGITLADMAGEAPSQPERPQLVQVSWPEIREKR